MMMAAFLGTRFFIPASRSAGKTTLNGALTLAWGFTQEAPNEILILANDLEQTLARVFKTMEGLIKFNPELQPEAEVQSQDHLLSQWDHRYGYQWRLPGRCGSAITGLVSYDELWGYISESSQRLWEELTPVPTRKNSIRFISTYAGFEGESKLLWDLYKQVVSKDEHPEGQGERIHPDLPIYCNREARLFAYWDHEPRMPWQTQEYYDSQKRTLRPGAYLRFHQNQWATAEEVFITPEMWDPNVDANHRPSTTTREPLFVGIDAGIKHDNAARVAVRWDEAGEKLILVSHRIWKPTPSQPLNLENTVEEDLRNLNEQSDVVEILADPYQMHRSITTLQAAGLPIREFPQTQANCTLMGQTLFDLLTGKNLEVYQSDELRQQALSTVAIENPRGWRIAKEKASKKIDAIVALAMACCAAMAHKGEIRRRQSSGFNIALHVSKGGLQFKPGWPLFIGQIYIDRNVTVIGQALDNGQVNVLAALISEGLSLQAHLEQHVRPWLSANVIEASRAATRRSPLLGALEDADDPALKSSVSSAYQTLRDFFVFEFGQLTTIKRPWEERRRAVMDVLVKSMKFTFKPALQLDPIHARSLAEALNTPFYERSDRTLLEKTNHCIINGLALMLLRAELWRAQPKPPKPLRYPSSWMSM